MSKCSVSKNVYRLLNKNLNFVPTGEVYNNKTQLKYDLNNFFQRMKLKGHFKDNKQTIQMNLNKEKKHMDSERKPSIELFIEAVYMNLELVIEGKPKNKKQSRQRRE